MLYKLSEEQEMFRQTVARFAKDKVAPRVSEMDKKDCFPKDLYQEILFSSCFKLSASKEQKERYLPDVVSGRKLCAFGLTEPDAGSDIASMRSNAILNGDEYILNGVKNFNSGIDFADMTLVYAKTDPNAGIKGISAFIVEKGTKGFSYSVTGKMMGFRGIHHYYAKERVQFGRPIAEFQAINHILADMATNTEAARQLVYRAATIVREHTKESMKLATMAKYFATDVAMKVTSRAVDILGGYGYSEEYPIERMMRDAKGLQIYEGTNQIQRNAVARVLLT
jgi:alkylation response protein AidB-like acyl-CoA dehydrogenase